MAKKKRVKRTLSKRADRSKTTPKTPKNDAALKQEFKNFLKSFHNSEALTTDLRKEISVSTKLPELVGKAVFKRPVVILTGAQGSGKTHILDTFRRDHLPKGCKCVEFPEQCSTKHVRLISDATPLTDTQKIDALSQSRGCQGVIVAINEGPLRAIAQKRHSHSHYIQAYDHLCRGRIGLTAPADEKQPTVIDMAAYDPIQDGVISRMLELPRLKEAVHETECGCSPTDCVRRRAWKQLESERVRKRVAEILKLALLARREWSFRQLWDLVADMAIGGSCSAEPNKTAWFYRLFYGPTQLSKALLKIVEPDALTLAQCDQYLYYNDLTQQCLTLVDGDRVTLIPFSKPERPEVLRWLRLQVLMLGTRHELEKRIMGGDEESLVAPVMGKQTGRVIKGINRYMGFGIKAGGQTKLDLWTSHQVKRKDRGERIRKDEEGQLCLAKVDSSDLEITTSRVVMNHPDPDCEEDVRGAKYYLTHGKSEASFELTVDVLDLLRQGRARRQSDRDQADLVGHLMKFFDAILSEIPHEREFDVADIQLDRLKFEHVGYTLSKDPLLIEELSK